MQQGDVIRTVLGSRIASCLPRERSGDVAAMMFREGVGTEITIQLRCAILAYDKPRCRTIFVFAVGSLRARVARLGTHGSLRDVRQPEGSDHALAVDFDTILPAQDRDAKPPSGA